MQASNRWKIFHPVNIYLYRNGREDAPTLVHIPGDKKTTMEKTLEEIQSRMKLPVGYPESLYHLDGTKVCKTFELEMYKGYVLLSNLDKRFKCANYGRYRNPLVVVGSHSQHVRVVKDKKNIAQLLSRRKQIQGNMDQLKIAHATNFDSDGYGPSELPYVSNASKECGVLCQRQRKPFDSNDLLQQRGGICEALLNDFYHLNGLQNLQDQDCGLSEQKSMQSTIAAQRELFQSQSQMQAACPNTAESLPPAPIHSTAKMADEGAGTEDLPFPWDKLNPLNQEHIIEFINSHKDLGGELFRLFKDRIKEDADYSTTGSPCIPKEKSNILESLENGNPGDEKNSNASVTTITVPVNPSLLIFNSFSDIKDISDEKAGNAPLPSDYDSTEDDIQPFTQRSSLSNSMSDLTRSGLQSQNDSERFGTTDPIKDSHKKVYSLRMENQNNPFYMQNGKLQVLQSYFEDFFKKR